MASALDDLLTHLKALPPEDLAALKDEMNAQGHEQVWYPNPGPQTAAYFSEADELFYGGQAGGGKSDLLFGLALTAHQRSLILRRTNKEAEKLIERVEEIIGNREGFNSQQGTLHTKDGRVLDLGGCQLEADKQKRKGIPHDLKGFDEISDFTETQYTFIIGWNRSTAPGQRCRVVVTGNPPTTAAGLWVIKRWGAWLDPKHPDPAKDGELRWFTTIDGQDTEVDGPGPHLVNGELVKARSRTFIRAKLSDNPDLAKTDYDSQLAALPEELRAAYRDGRFDMGLKDKPFQCIPTDWVRQAQARWTPERPAGVPMCAIGVDVASGGDDNTVLAPRYDGYYPELIKKPGRETPLGRDVAGMVIANRRDGAVPVIDMGGGYGGAVHEHLTQDNGIECVAYKGAAASTRRTKDNMMRFSNVRTEAYWRFREALDPSQPGGSSIALPPSATLFADLTAPSYEVKKDGNGLLVELQSKEDVCKDLNRSPDEGDAVVMGYFAGATYHDAGQDWAQRRMAKKRPSDVKVVMGYSMRRRR